MPGEPLLSIVTPCLNPGPALDRALRSVASAPDGLVEHIIMDGGSTDGSVERIAAFARARPGLVTHWSSAPDAGQSDAINRGFERARGRFGGWLNADDWYQPDALRRVVERLRGCAADVLVARAKFVDEHGRSIWEPLPPNPVRLDSLMRLRGGWFAGRSIAQPEAFFRLDRFRGVGGTRVENHYSMDHELWMELAAAGARFEDWPVHVANLGVHARQKTADRLGSARCIAASTRGVLERHRGALGGRAGAIERGLDLLDARIAFVDRVEAWWRSMRDAPRDPARAPRWDAAGEHDSRASRSPCQQARHRAIVAARKPFLDWLRSRGRPRRVLIVARGEIREFARLGLAETMLFTPPSSLAPRGARRLEPGGPGLGSSGRFDLVITENVLACGPEAIARDAWDSLEPGGTWAALGEPRAGPEMDAHLARVRDELRAAITREGRRLISRRADACLSSAASLSGAHAAAEPFADGINIDAIMARIAPDARPIWRHDAPSLGGVPLAPFDTDALGPGWTASAWTKP